MCKKGIGRTLAQIGLPLAGAVGGNLLGPEVGLTAGEGAGIGGLLGGAGAGFATGASPLGIAENALAGGAGGWGIGSVLGPEVGFGPGGAFAGPTVASAGGAPGTTAAGLAATGDHADAIGGASADASTTAPGDSGGGIMDFIKRNPWLVPVAGTGLAGIMGNKPMPGEKQLKQLAAQAGDLSKLSSSVLTGQLPPGAEGLVQNALNDTIAGIRAKYANMGISGSTMEAQDIAAAQERAAAQTFEIASKLTTQGLDAAGLSAQIYEAIAQNALQEDTGLSTALANLSSAGGYAGGLKSVA